MLMLNINEFSLFFSFDLENNELDMSNFQTNFVLYIQVLLFNKQVISLGVLRRFSSSISHCLLKHDCNLIGNLLLIADGYLFA